MADVDTHFAVHEDRGRSSRSGSRGGRSSSPSHSAHSIFIRNSIIKMSERKRAKKVRFYRNGDRYYGGIIYAVSTERFRSFESLLAELTLSPLGDKNVLPNGVRHIFSFDGNRKITHIDQIQEGENYVCASIDVFKRIDYSKISSPNWNVNTTANESRGASPSVAKETLLGDNKDYIRPKLVTVIRNGIKPRKAIRILLNRKTAHSFDQVLTYMTDAIKLDTGAVKKIYTIDGKQVL